ncbi:PREDICTED: uncharacterized protein LOC109168459 [Ipomoea nil]|uniref:uncharacterized protein LOC109168459 n=1 Tax=Ipomoea nil TaxID=35883 RepID=UPI000900BD27|nr:PREDICTED: uncharacterized protein LOC109168459 [Ipomoea nil]
MVKEYKKVSFPNMIFRLKSISSLVRKKNIDEKMLIDVIGRVTKIYFPVGRVVAGQRARLIDFVLEDINEDQIQCTLWGDQVDSLLPIYSSTVTEEPWHYPEILYSLFPYGDVHISTSFNATKIWINQRMPDFEEFKKRLSLSSNITPLRKLDSSSRLTGFRPNCNILSDDIVVTSLSEIYKRKELYEYWVAVKIMDVDSSDGWYYKFCKRTNCGKKANSKRSTCETTMLIWNKECYDLVGVSASTLREKYVENAKGWISPELQSICEMPILFRISMKKDQVDSLISAFGVLGFYCDVDATEQTHEDSFGLDEFGDFEMVGFDEGGSSGNVASTLKRSLMDEFNHSNDSKRLEVGKNVM